MKHLKQHDLMRGTINRYIRDTTFTFSIRILVSQYQTSSVLVDILNFRRHGQRPDLGNSHLVSSSHHERKECMSLDEFDVPFEPVLECNLPASSEPNASINRMDVMTQNKKGCEQSVTPTTLGGEGSEGKSSSTCHA